MDYVPTPAAAFQSSAQRISRVFACLQSSISSMHHITRSTCLGELPASLCHCASQKSCRPWSSWPACQYSAGIRSLPRRAACHLLSSRGLRPWSSCQPACILQASVRAGASCVPSPCHREIFVPGRAASLPAFCRHPFVPGRASVPSPSIARSSCLVELPACLQVCKRPFVPRRASCHLLSSRGLRACSSYKPACILHASVRDRASCVPHFCHRASQSLRASSSCPACLHSAGISSCRASCVPSPVIARCFVPGRAASLPCILQATGWCWGELRAISYHREIFVPGRAASLPAFCSIRSCCGELRARILPSRIARSLCLVELPACLHSAGHPFVPGRAACLNPAIAHRKVSVPGRASSLPAFCRHPFVPWRAACQILPIAHRKVSVPGRAASLPAFCRHPFVPGRAACQNPAIAHSKISAPGQAASLPAFCRHPLVLWRAACQNPAIAHRKISVPGQLPACLHSAGIRSALGQTAWQNPAIAHRKISVPGQAASLPAFCRHPLVLWRAACQNPAIAHRKVSVPGRAASLPAFCRHPFVPGRAACQKSCHRASQDLRAWSSCQPACILQASVRAGANCVADSCHRASQGLHAWSSCQPACILQASVRARASCVPESCHRASQDLRAWSSCQPACILQASVRAGANCVADSCHRASQGLRAWSSCQPACILQASVRARASCVPSPVIARSSYLVELSACLHSAVIHPCRGERRAISYHREVFVPGRAASLPAFCRHPFVPGRAACHHLSSRGSSYLVRAVSLPAFLQSSARAVASCVPDSCHHASQSLRALVKLPACLHSAGIRSCCGELRARILPSRIARSPCLVELPACLQTPAITHRKVSVPGQATSLPAFCRHPLVLWRAACQTPAIAHRKVSHAWSSCQPACRLLPSRIAKSPRLVKLPACLHSAGIRSCCGELRARILPSRIARSPCLVKLLACPHSAGIRSCHGELRARLLPSRIGKSSVPGRASSLPAFCRHPFVPGRAACQNPAIAHRKVSVPGRSCQPACILQTSVRCRGELRARLLPSRIARSPCLVILQASIRAGVSCVPSLVIARSSCLVKLPACLHSAGIRSCRGELRAVRI
ncbi:uncharacterized protein [Maniola hyperantus]|uniref:uncharacterized protein isoform X32 n=1 Tax=Aphantopus hyperantus TaxID=2795564 RepID=UPI0037487115